MKPLNQIIIGKADAVNYYKGVEKEFLNKTFFNDDKFREILKKEIFFVLGDKGTGKTAFAVYTANNETAKLKATLKFTTETDFKKFISLISTGKITVSDFISVWKVILLLLVAKEVKTNLDESYIGKFFLLQKLDRAINKYYDSAFSPEITNAIEIFDKADVFLDFLKGVNVSTENSEKIKKTGFQINLLEIENEFRKSLAGIKLRKDFILFIDGTDQVPFDIKKVNYTECLRGLANAVWDLNQFVFPEILADDKHYLKIVLLLRPDVFSIIRFHNANAKLKDNTTILNWVARETYWRNSRIFKMADNIFSSQQDSRFALGYCWDAYFDKEFEFGQSGNKLFSFVAVLRRTLMRPRDIFAFLDIMHKEAINAHSNKITNSIFNNSLPEYSRYLLGEIKDQFNFFHDDAQWQAFIDFFKYFNGVPRFTYDYFLSCYDRFIIDFPSASPNMFGNPDTLLQEMYDYNIIGYVEESAEEEFYKWSYKERSHTNLVPLVRYESEYIFHIGLFRAIGVGRIIRGGRV